VKHTRETLADGYKEVRDPVSRPCNHHRRLLQYPIFKFPTIDRWIVVVSGKYTEELLRAPGDVLSMVESLRTVGLSRLNLSVTHAMTVSVSEK
jgi:hypothetical protein